MTYSDFNTDNAVCRHGIIHDDCTRCCDGTGYLPGGLETHGEAWLRVPAPAERCDGCPACQPDDYCTSCFEALHQRDGASLCPSCREME